MTDKDQEDREAQNAVKRMLGGFSAKTRAGIRAMNAVKVIPKAIAYSKEAEKAYWDTGSDGLRTGADFDRAEALVKKGIALLDEAGNDFPQLSGAFNDMRLKLNAQLEDIGKCRAGIVEKIELKTEEKP